MSPWSEQGSSRHRGRSHSLPSREMKGEKQTVKRRVKATQPAKYRIEIEGFSHQSKTRLERCGKLCVNPVVVQVEMCVRMVFPETPKMCTQIGHCNRVPFPLGAPGNVDYTCFRSQEVDTKSQSLRQRLSAGRCHFQLRPKEERSRLRGCLEKVPSGAVKRQAKREANRYQSGSGEELTSDCWLGEWGFRTGGFARSFRVIPGGYGTVAQVRDGEKASALM